MAKHVINRIYSQFWDHKSGVQFTEVLDVKKGLKIGHALTDTDFSDRPSFETVSDAEYARIISGADVDGPTAAAPSSETGDPLSDALAQKNAGAGDSLTDAVKAKVADKLAPPNKEAVPV